MKGLMLQGTGSGVGKSLLTAGLCRLLRRSGVRVAPFKPQNMSNNAAACAGGGEIGRAQALQAFACGLEPHVDMNPVLIKPEGDSRAQLVVLGRAQGALLASRFRLDRAPLLPVVTDAFERLASRFDFVLVEGAGSPAEPNLRTGDLANMGFAEAVGLDAWLIGDIDRGGVFASLLGSLETLDAPDRARVRAFVINRFRGDRALVDDALAWLERKTSRPVLGVVPYVPDLRLPEEDAAYGARSWERGGSARVVAIHYPTASNLSDLDALALVPDLDVEIVDRAEAIAGADLVILPGSKAVLGDLAWLREKGFVPLLERHLRYGGKLLGLCGGMQMLGERIEDPLGLEDRGTHQGLDWLPIRTVLRAEKRVEEVELDAAWPQPHRVRGYEIHHGETSPSRARAPFHAISEDEQVFGTYLHGLFDLAPYRQALLEVWLGRSLGASPDLTVRWQRDLDRLADVLQQSLDLSDLEARVGARLR